MSRLIETIVIVLLLSTTSVVAQVATSAEPRTVSQVVSIPLAAAI